MFHPLAKRTNPKWTTKGSPSCFDVCFQVSVLVFIIVIVVVFGNSFLERGSYRVYK
jgi:hypothetical protein